MKKILSLLVVIAVVFSLTACAEKETTAVGVVTDTGGIDDASFNQSTYEGAQRFADENNLGTVPYLQSETDSDYVPNLSSMADKGIDLIVAPGYLFSGAIAEVATSYPDQHFLIIDACPDGDGDWACDDLDNVVTAVFAAEQGSFLVGYVAGNAAVEAGAEKVGFLGGMEGELIGSFEAGYAAGVKYAADEAGKDIEVLVEYADSFSDAAIGQTLSAKMYDDGAYVIYQAAGGAGNGAINEAKQRRTNGEDVWVIGVDKDQFEAGKYDGDNSAILISMVKKVDVAAYTVAEQEANGEFPGGDTLVFDLSNGGVGVPETNPNVADEVVTKLDELTEMILSGDIVVPAVPSR